MRQFARTPDGALSEQDAAALPIGSTVEYNATTWEVRHVLTDKFGKVVLCLLSPHQYLPYIPASKCRLLRRADDGEAA